ncbi:MAG: patatin-like phospholipase family protein [Acidobacteriota bacterium]
MAGTEPGSAIGLAMAGGAAQGAIYEIGALRALDEAVEGVDFNQLGVYVGVSAGGFLASCLANGLSTAQMCRAIVKPEPGEHPFVPEIFFQPAAAELRRRLWQSPKIIADALWQFASRRERRLIDSLTGLGRALPVALFANEPIRNYVHTIFQRPDRTDDFRRLKGHLVVVATDLESGEAIRFGEPGLDQVPISRAVQASTALPGLYPPVEINGRYYVDGVLLKTMHASVALERGAKLVFCVNPIVPVDVRRAIQRNEIRSGQLIDNGLPTVLSQTLRTLIHSRMNLGIRAYKKRYPDADVVLIEPRKDDVESFFSNIFTFRSRQAMCERAYQTTRRTLWQRRDEIGETLAKHGLRLREEMLEDFDRPLWPHVGLTSDDPSTNLATDTQEVVSELDRLIARAQRLVAARQT